MAAKEAAGIVDINPSLGNQPDPILPKKVPTKKICCACPETKKARDACLIVNGEDGCKALIEVLMRIKNITYPFFSHSASLQICFQILSRLGLQFFKACIFLLCCLNYLQL